VDRPTFDFYISYAHKDQAWAEWIAWVLEEEGYSTILQAWDFVAGSNFVMEMDRASREAARTIAVLSPEYMRSDFTPSEWAAAFAKDPKGQGRKLLPVRVAECNVDGLLTQIVWVDLVDCDAEEAQHRLATAATGERLKPSTRPGFPGAPERQVPTKPPYPTDGTRLVNVPRRNRNFTGRESALEALHTALAEKQEVILPQAVTGLGGVGKTQLAIEYACRYGDQYELIGWMRAEEEESLIVDLFSVARAMGLKLAAATPPEDMLGRLYRALAERNDWLLVFDNAGGPGTLRKYLPKIGSGHLIITSRNPNWRSLANPIDVNPFERHESIAFLLKRTGRTEDDGADAVAEALGDLPLALEQAGGYMEQTVMDFRRYATLFEKRHRDLWKNQKAPNNYQATVSTTWSLSLEKLQVESPVSIALLQLSSFLAAEEIPAFLLHDGAKELPAPLAEAAAEEVALSEALAGLRRYGLIEVSDAGYSVHRLVQTVVRDGLDKKSYAAWLTSAVRVLVKVHDFRKDDPSSWTICTRLLPHVAAAVGHAEEHGIVLQQCGYLLNDAGLCLLNGANLQLALQYFERALKIAETVYGPDHPEVAATVNNLGSVLKDLGQLKEAKPAFERALKIAETVYGPDHPKVATAVDNLGAVLKDLGQLKEAKAAHERALKIDETVYGPDHPEVATTVNNLGSVLQDLGQLEEAKAAFERALKIDETVYGPDHPKVAATVNNLGLVLKDLGQLKEAKPAFERALKIDETVYGPDHPEVAATVNNLGAVLKDLGQLKEAKPAFERALKIAETVYGPDHPKVATAVDNLGAVLQDLGQLKEAKAAHERALKIAETVYGPDHPTVATTVNNLGAVLQDLGQLEEAKAAFERALKIDEKVYGPEHPTVAIRVNNLGWVLQDLGQLEEAKAAFERALRILERFLGPEHPKTCIVRSSLEALGKSS